MTFSNLWAKGLVLLATTFASANGQLSVAEVAGSNSDFSTLFTALRLSGLASVLDCFGPICSEFSEYARSEYTVFAPVNDAFEDLPEGLLEKLTTEKQYLEHLFQLLLYHVLDGRVEAAQIIDNSPVTAPTLHGESITAIATADGGVIINDSANVVLADVEADNGIVHAIDAVLVPSFLTNDVVGVAQAAGTFQTLLTAATAAGLVEALQTTELTLFAPTDEAFEALGADAIESLLADTDLLTQVLTYHVLPGIVPSYWISAGLEESLQGEDILINFEGESSDPTVVLNNRVKVLDTDILASNGIIHSIDTVLLPPSLNPPTRTIYEEVETIPALSTLLTAIDEADLESALSGDGPLTLFAPTDEAFAKLDDGVLNDLLADQEALANVLLYHVVSGNVKREDLSDGIVTAASGDNMLVDTAFTSVEINDEAAVTRFNIESVNGVIHLIDTVLIPPPSILDIATSNTDFSILAQAVAAAELVEVLEGGPFTVFAPTDEAFGKLPEGTLETLLEDPTGTLRDILLYHVVSGNVLFGDLAPGPVTTAQGADIDVGVSYLSWTSTATGATLNGNTKVDIPDIVASNGVIHVIDTVLLPP